MALIERIEGTITRTNGTTTSFLITGSGYSQWDGTTPQLGNNVDALTALAEAAEPHLHDPYTQNTNDDEHLTHHLTEPDFPFIREHTCLACEDRAAEYRTDQRIDKNTQE